MALIAPSIAAIVAGNLAAAQILGITQPRLASAISIGFSSYVLSSVTVTTVDAGIAGSGTGFGQGIFLAPPILQGALNTTFAGAGILGIFQQPLIAAIANSISQSLLTATILTVDVGVGTGAGVVATLIPNSVSHIASMYSAFISHGIAGPYSIPLATAIATGIDASLPSSRGFTVIAGGGAPPPSSGVGIGRLV